MMLVLTLVEEKSKQEQASFFCFPVHITMHQAGRNPEKGQSEGRRLVSLRRSVVGMQKFFYVETRNCLKKVSNYFFLLFSTDRCRRKEDLNLYFPTKNAQ